MKYKIFSIIIITLLISSFLAVGCSGDNPEKTISLYSTYLKSEQFDKIYDLLSKESLGGQTKEQYIESLGMNSDEDESTKIMMESLIKYFDFKPLSSEIKGNEAVVKTEITMPNMSKIFYDLLPDLFALAFTSNNIDEAANELMMNYLKENTLETIKVTKDIRLVQEDGWKIDINSFELFELPDLESTKDTSEEEETTITEVSEIETTEEEKTTTAEIKYLQKGEIVSITNWDYKVEDVKVQETVGEYSARGVFIVALVEVTNTSNSGKEVGSQIFKAMDEQGRIYNMSTEASLEYYHEYNSDLWYLDELGPSLTGVLPIVFDIPKNATNIALITEGDNSNPILLLDITGSDTSKETTFKDQEIVSITNWDYKVEDVKVQETVGEYSARGVFIVALVEVTNTSNSGKEVGSQIFKAMDEQGRIYNMSTEASLEYYHEYNSDLWYLDELGPSLTGVLPIVFDIPKNATNIALITEGDNSNPILLLESINN